MGGGLCWGAQAHPNEIITIATGTIIFPLYPYGLIIVVAGAGIVVVAGAGLVPRDCFTALSTSFVAVSISCLRLKPSPYSVIPTITAKAVMTMTQSRLGFFIPNSTQWGL